MATLIAPNGVTSVVLPACGSKFKLAELQSFVGGDIEPIWLGKDLTMLVNEEGKIRQFAFNEEATELAREAGIADSDVIVGPALVIHNEEWE